METKDPPPPTHRCVNQVVAGLLVIALGLVLFAQRQAGAIGASLHLWPLFPIVIGLARFSSPDIHPAGCRPQHRSGLWLMMVGVWGLINEYHVAGFTYGTSWPLLVVAAGILLVWRSFDMPAVPGGPTRGAR